MELSDIKYGMKAICQVANMRHTKTFKLMRGPLDCTVLRVGRTKVQVRLDTDYSARWVYPHRLQAASHEQ